VVVVIIIIVVLVGISISSVSDDISINSCGGGISDSNL
jgi:hypothetical protein